MSETKKNTRSWRLFSLETLLCLTAIGLLAGGIIKGTVMGIFWGVLVLVGLVALHFVRKKDWEKHWQEQERRHR